MVNIRTIVAAVLLFVTTAATAVTYVATPSIQHSNRLTEPDMLPKCPYCKTSRTLADIRVDNFGTITGYRLAITKHIGNSIMDESELRETIYAVMHRLNNIEYTDDVVNLLFETVLVGSKLGYRDYAVNEGDLCLGVTQIRADYATHTLTWLLFNRLDIYNALLRLNEPTWSAYHGVAYSVPVNVGLAMEYYWLTCPDLSRNISSLDARARLWTYTFAPRQLTEDAAIRYYKTVVTEYQNSGIKKIIDEYPPMGIASIK